jgi:hypothetical protein
MKRLFVGITPSASREVFQSFITPTADTHGEKYLACIGPFRTRKAANFMSTHGRNNPHLQTVADAERIVKLLN